MRRALDIVREMGEREVSRGISAERRAAVVLVILGILAGFVALMAESVVAGNAIQFDIMVGSLFAIVIGFLAKATYYALRVNGISQSNVLTHDLTETIQSETELQSLRTEVAWRRWEIEQQIPGNTHKLFWLSRSQRSATAALFSLLGLVVVVLLQDRMSAMAIAICGWAALIMGVALVMFLDPVLEERGFWSWHW
jgi:hypothetical protein